VEEAATIPAAKPEPEEASKRWSATEVEKKKPAEPVKSVAPGPVPEPPSKGAGATKDRRKEKVQKGKGKKRY